MSSRHEPLRKSERKELERYLGLAPTSFLRARSWPGGRELRDRVRADLDRGEAAVHTVHVLEGIVVEDGGRDGPIVFVQSELMGVIRFAGAYLSRELERGFPWPRIVIREAPGSRVFFGVSGKEGDPIKVLTRGPLTSMEAESLGPFDEEYVRLRMDFDTLKSKLAFARGS